MPIDFNRKDGRKAFIDNNLSDLLSGINDTYGPIILEELLKRIESTINDFNDQINDAFNTLKQRDKKRKEFLNEIIPAGIDSVNDKKKSEWEEKLEKIESSK